VVSVSILYKMSRMIVDGYNVIRCDPYLRSIERDGADKARLQLVQLLGKASKLAAYQIVVVFDGPPSRGFRPNNKVKVIYSGRDSADDLIVNMAKSDDLVVTNDSQLRARTLQRGPKVWSVEKLLDTIRPRSGGSRKYSPQSDPKPSKAGVSKLRSFSVCKRCIFFTRDDWIMLCVEDLEMGTPKNFRDRW